MGPMRTNRPQLAALGLVLLVCITVLTPLAYASPADPSWILGMYDAADHDEVVFLITSALDAIVPIGKADVGAARQTVLRAKPLDNSIFAAIIPSPQPRAPPKL